MCVHLCPFTRIFTVPRALNFGSNSSRVHRHHACLHHARQGDLLRHFAVGAGGINHRKHFISVRHRADGRKAMQTLVIVPAIISVLRPVAFTAATNSGLSRALISPLRATYCACGALAWISGISGPFGPCGTDAVVITGIFASEAILPALLHGRAAQALACLQRSGTARSGDR